MIDLLTIRKQLLLLPIIVFSGLCNVLVAQCTADFTFDANGIFYQFTNTASVAETDSIVAYNWDFGDGSTSSDVDPSHVFTFPDSYEVTFSIETREGCTDTASQTVTNCSLGLTAAVGTNCNDGLVDLALSIKDNFNVVEHVDVLLDGQSINPAGYELDQLLNINLKAPGDGAIHTITLQSDYSDECFEEFFFVSEDCSVTCIFSSIAVDVNTDHTIEVRDTTFFPANRIINIGDTVNFDWVAPANSTTSDTTEGPDVWDSGVLFVGSSFQVIPQTIGVKPYYSITRGGPGGEGMSGTIIVNCPPEGIRQIDITVQNNPTSQGGFKVAIDDVFLSGEQYSYDPSGVTSLSIPYPFDGLQHKVSVQDITNPKCNLSQVVSAFDCEGTMPCNVNVSAYQISRCNESNSVSYTVDVNAIGYSSEGFSVLLDGAFTLDTLQVDSTGFATGTYTLLGDGLSHSITVRDLGTNNCSDVAMLTVSDCDAPCNLSDLTLLSATQPPLELNINNTGISDGQVAIPSKQGILLRWTTDRVYGIRGTDSTTDSILWDSGLKTNGEIFITPILTEPTIDYEIYDRAGGIVTTNQFVTLEPCDDGLVPIFVSFIDENGSSGGYNIIVDGEPITDMDYYYLNGNRNYAAFSLLGDDTTHTVTVQDKTDPSCSISSDILLRLCNEFECKLQLSIPEPDTCFNDDRVLLSLNVVNTNPLPRGFRITRNGTPIFEMPEPYQSDSLSVVLDTVFANGDTFDYIVTDDLNETCTDTFSITPEPCVTNCVLSGLSLQLVDEAYLAANPNTPAQFVGCQSDTTHFVAVSFTERYSDGSQYTIYVDEVLFASPIYAPGDGANLAFVPVFADSIGHLIRVTDQLSGICTVQDSVHMPKCFTECIYEVQGLAFADCQDESSKLDIYLNRTAPSGALAITENGTTVVPTVIGDTVQLQVIGDGLPRQYIISEVDNPLCTDTINTTAPYCLNCDLSYELTQLDSCANGDLVSYSLSLSTIAAQQISITVGADTDTVPTAVDYLFDVVADGSAKVVTLSSLTDIFCSESFEILTEDCSPIICEADFTIEENGNTYTFVDASVTSEPIVSQSWQIEGGITVMNTASFTFVFDTTGIYTVCHSIETDSCTDVICKQISVNPCNDLMASFTLTQDGDVYSFVSTSTGSIDSLVYLYGDGNSSSEPSNMHTYAENGTYEVCLEVYDLVNMCSDEQCQELDFISSNQDPAGNETVRVYPNPAGVGSKMHIESSASITGYALYGGDGKLIQSADTFGPVDRLSFIVQEMPQGQIGIVHVKTAKGTFTRKIIVN